MDGGVVVVSLGAIMSSFMGCFILQSRGSLIGWSYELCHLRDVEMHANKSVRKRSESVEGVNLGEKLVENNTCRRGIII